MVSIGLDKAREALKAKLLGTCPSTLQSLTLMGFAVPCINSLLELRSTSFELKMKVVPGQNVEITASEG